MAGRGKLEATPPTLWPLGALSPSSAEALLNCRLKVMFGLDPGPKTRLPVSTAQALGIVAHELTADVWRGIFAAVSENDLEQALAATWSERVGRQHRLMQSAAQQGLVPPPERWRNYAMDRARLLRTLIVRARSQRPSVAPSGKSAIERWLESSDGDIRGRIDRVEPGPDGVNIIDLKTAPGTAGEMDPAHRRQLLIYAVLWQRTSGEWPALASIERLDGSRATITVEPGEAERLVGDLDELRTELNRLVSVGVAPETLASPSADNCRGCDHRGRCGPLLQAADDSWDWYRLTVAGVVIDTREGNDTGRLTIRLAGGTLPADITTIDIQGFNPRSLPQAGTFVAVVDALPARGAQPAHVDWQSQLWTWPSVPVWARPSPSTV